MKNLCKNSRRLMGVCYALAAAAWLALAVFGMVRAVWARSRGDYPRMVLTAQELVLNSFVNYADLEWDTPPYEDPDLYLSTDSDPQLIWQGGGYVESVVLYADHYTPPGAVALYYLLPGQTDFSERQKVYGAVTGSGEYTFTLDGKTVAGLRIDPDSRGGIATRFTGVQLNPAHSLLWYLIPRGGQWLLLLSLPALAAAVIKLLAEIYFLGGKHD